MADQAPSTPIGGIQIGAVSFVDEGVTAVLDVLQEKGAVNALMLATPTLGAGRALRDLAAEGRWARAS